MWPGSIVLSVIVLLLLPFSSCREKVPDSVEAQLEENVIDTLPDDFVAFFDRFHEDSAYQMQHIIFPLEGLPPITGDIDTLPTERFFWQKKDWTKHNRFTDPGGHFDHWYLVINERIIEHWIQAKGTNVHMKRRFAKLEDGWYLIYYMGMRPINTASGQR